MELLIKANQINVEYAGREILDIENLEIYTYDRIGLVGGNGVGKSTLLDILTNKSTPLRGKVQRFGEIAYIPQLESVTLEETHDLSTLSRLGLSGVSQETMSGGEETRAKIAVTLSKQVHALFADEPTCHLDQVGIDFLINQLKAFDGAVLIISHDRYFLDKTVDKIWELKDGIITEYWGGYSDYLTQKKEEFEQQATQYKTLMLEKERLERSIMEKRKHAQKLDKSAKNTNESAGRLGHQKTTGSKEKKIHNAAKNMEKRIESLGEMNAPESVRSIRFRQNKALELHNKFPITGDGINLSYGERVIFKDASFVIPLGSKVAFTGINGIGKTTLLKMILDCYEGLTISPKAVIGYLSQTGYKIESNQSVISFMQENCDYNISEIRSVLASMGFGINDINKNIQVLSGGEISKLLLSKLLLGQYNILLMDEPSNYLDIYSIEALEKMMKDYAGTIIFISHDQRLIDNVADTVYEIWDCKINLI